MASRAYCAIGRSLVSLNCNLVHHFFTSHSNVQMPQGEIDVAMSFDYHSCHAGLSNIEAKL